MKSVDEIREELFSLSDEKYRDFQGGLIPNVEGNKFIGVRTPALRSLAKRLVKEGETREFLNDLPHKYFDENQLHAFIICEIRSFEECLDELIRFLPYIDNWATCDQLSPKAFKKHAAELLPYAESWMKSNETYTVRYGIGILMRYFLGEAFDISYAEAVAKIRSEEYYINMMIAWYFATALAKNYNDVLPFIENKRLDNWTHNKAIQKAVESYRVTDEQKAYLKTLKIK